MKHPPGTTCYYRMYGPQVVRCKVIGAFLFIRLVEWTARDMYDGGRFYKAGWRPVWRLYEFNRRDN